MKTLFCKLFLLLSLNNLIYAQKITSDSSSIVNIRNQSNNNEYRTYSIKVRKIIEVCYPIEKMTERHLSINNQNRNKFDSNNFVVIKIFPSIDKKLADKKVFDSLYSTNDLSLNSNKNDEFTSYYSTVEIINKNNKAIYGISDYDTIYEFEYLNHYVLIVSSLSLRFKETGSAEIPILKCTKRKDYKRKIQKFNLETTYFQFTKNFLTEIRYRNIIYPTWTGGLKMF